MTTIRGLSFILLVVALSPALALAQNQADFVGTWYSETPGTGTINGSPYEMRRELLNNRNDSTKTNTNRYYHGNQTVAETVGTYSWGVADGVYWTECRTVLSNGAASTCSRRNEYDIISVNPREIRYKSRTSGTTYSMLRVADDFRLP